MAPTDSDLITLRSGDLVARISPLGAQLSVLQDAAGRDLLWGGDPAVWAGRAPILFPIVGTLAGGSYRLGDKSFAMSRHGFARGKPFTLLPSSGSAAGSRSGSGSEALFRLEADSSTLPIYPFEFRLDVRFKLDGPALEIVSTVSNLGPSNMPASIGYHPGFRWPLPYGQPREDHYIEFDQVEPAPIRRLDANGLLDPVPRPTPITGRRLSLEDSLFREDVVIFDDLFSRSCTYGAATGPKIRVDFPDARYLGVWTRPGAGFICIEPWQGIADPAGSTGDLASKPGIVVLAPGAAHSLTMRIVVQ